MAHRRFSFIIASMVLTLACSGEAPGRADLSPGSWPPGELARYEELNLLDFGMDPKTAVETPYFMTPVLSPTEWSKQTVAEGDFPSEVLDGVRARGQELEVVAPDEVIHVAGAWIGIAIDPETGRMTGGVSPLLNGIADGY